MAAGRRPGSGNSKKKGPSVGTGGHGRRRLEGKGPTPKAEDRPYHKAYKMKQAAERRSAARPKGAPDRGPSRGHNRRGPGKTEDLVTGRNAVLESLRAGIPARTLYLASRLEVDDRIRDILKLCAESGVPVLEASKPELDRLTEDAVHQGVALQVPPYEYEDAEDLIAETMETWQRDKSGTVPLIVALDGITDPRNLGAIIRSVSAFAGDAVILPERRSTGVTATAWKTSAGAAARVPVAKATNLNRAVEKAKALGYFVVGLDGGGDIELPSLELATEPLLVVVGSEGKGLSRLTTENCDQIVSIPIDSAMESLNASMAVGITLYEIARRRAEV
ncbi:23S rRNA (guanosine(2251)-2'-O)-methyltransferase RlmB [Kocuria coralli]|uniref:23S rRNA (Guanosine(2251)-2'-O)-methyltransferase RlmB n=1 Tax=Kocuria coralli TaxID=1461025 RepID=A0A5J5KW24_9MICC|nr:23S rRNA (guanosine(2251)-2'-O)-methyltransferase RlmB [Kocuria coralli]KAA9393460.1 23S rRNA (guanosine(2251)-2'-O)-methyltransferase RlmB [Kocuria coralli]